MQRTVYGTDIWNARSLLFFSNEESNMQNGIKGVPKRQAAKTQPRG